MRQLHRDGRITTSLVISKARVAPLKSLTIPRAELAGAYLLAKLLSYSSHILCVTEINAWTDSAIVLCWLRKVPSSLNVFVGNRVAAIHELLLDAKWRHVNTHDNPADILSRGSSTTNLNISHLWWEGPPWLRLPPEQWPPPQFTVLTELPETKAVTLLVPALPSQQFWETFSSFTTLVRTYAWVRRFAANARLPAEKRQLTPHLTAEECHSTKRLFFRLVQVETYPEAVQAVQRNSHVPKAHSLSGFNLSLTDDGLPTLTTRVRDFRLHNRPRVLIPLSIKSSLVRLYVTDLHIQYHHAGPQTLLSIISDSHYIPALRNFLKGLSRRCTTCQRAYSRGTTQQLGLLPASRTTPAPPFSETGLDFAGPFYVRRGHVRRPVLIKSYVCVFVCTVTKAVHLELSSDLSTEEFLAALRRFCARRGTPLSIRSDNGSNFVGAYHDMQDIQSLLSRSANGISSFCGKASIAWKFIPPRTPHMGGLWEATVKLMKTLLHKIVTPHPLQFHELYTVLTEVEATLNSRPLTPLNSTDADDQLTLTPGHFLIGRPLLAPPTHPAKHSKINNLRRWQLVQRLTHDFWVAWKSQYLQHIQRRHTWKSGHHTFSQGDVVFLKDDDSFGYRRWPLARIETVYPGDDGVVRVVDVQCKGKTLRRAAHQLIPLYSEDDSPAPPSPVCSGPHGTEQSRAGRTRTVS